MSKLSPPQAVAVSFALAIAIGTILLWLPISNVTGKPTRFIDSLFTATSATCVTGLIVKDTGGYFSGFGQGVILLLMQMGGLGIMTFSTLFAILLGRKLTLRENLVVQSALDQHKVEGLRSLVKYIVLITLGIEFLGAVFLFFRWSSVTDWPTPYVLYCSVFHSVSGFCNAGFSLFSSSFAEYRSDIFINSVMMFLIFVGGIGFVVIVDLWKFFGGKKRITAAPRISLQTKLVLTVSLILIILGTLVIFFLEKDNVLSQLTFRDKLTASLFHSITPRTAGFNTLPVGEFMPATLLFVMFLMFVGASPGSTGGGLKTATFGILLATFYSISKNRNRVFLFGRTIPKTTVRRCLTVLVMAIALITSVAFILLISESHLTFKSGGFASILFETTSAFGTVGLTTGITPFLSDVGKFLIVLTMFIGRVGPLTLALAVALRQDKVTYLYPEESIMVG
jgi:trk system potassium uptake protein TrkH